MSKSKEQDTKEVIVVDNSQEVAEVVAEGDVEQDGQQEKPTYPRLAFVIRRPATPKKSRTKFYSRYPRF